MKKCKHEFIGLYNSFALYAEKYIRELSLKSLAAQSKKKQLLRENGEKVFDDLDALKDYSQGIDGLPKENVLRFDFNDGSWAAARPSGTEPKLKLYFSVKGENSEVAKTRQSAISAKLMETMGL